MTNQEIKALQARVEAGSLLDQQEQLLVLQQLLRANRRIMDAVKAGYPTLVSSPTTAARNQTRQDQENE